MGEWILPENRAPSARAQAEKRVLDAEARSLRARVDSVPAPTKPADRTLREMGIEDEEALDMARFLSDPKLNPKEEP